MKKSTKDRNVLRAMTIGIAVMMATATPMSVFAAEENGVGANDGNTTTNTGSESQNTVNTSNTEGETASASEIVKKCETAEKTAGEAKTLTAEITNVLVTDDGKTTIPEEDANKILGTADKPNIPSADEFDTIAGEVSSAKTIIQGALVYDGNATSFVNAGNTDLGVAEADLQTMYNGTSAVFDNADSAVNNATTANTSSSEEEARAAASNARSNLATAEGNLATIEAAYTEADNKLTTAQADYDAALGQYNKANDELTKAHNDLKDAKTNATAVNEKMKGLKAIVDNMEQKVSDYSESVKELEDMRDQYYSMLVYYHRSNGSAVYYENGKLNVEASAKKKAMTTKRDNLSYELGRDLARQMVEYMVMHEENVDPATADFKFGVTDSDITDKKVKVETVSAREGTVFTNSDKNGKNKGVDQTATKDPTKEGKDGYHLDINGKEIRNKEAYDLVRYTPNQKDAGRTNFYVATYKDKDGNEITKNFNYIFKESAYGDAMDFETGTIFLAEITKGEDGKYVATRLSGKDYVMDDYQQLQKAIAATEIIKQYEAVKKAVDDAAAKVDELEKQIAYLESVKIDSSKLTELAGRLDAARGQLAEYSSTKEELEGEVAKARAAVAAIDLSRFGTGSEGADADDDTSDVFTFAGQQPGQTVAGTNVIMGTTANVQPDAAANGNNTVVIGQRQTPRSATFKTNDNKSDKKLTKLDNNQVPLAAMPSEDETSMSWWWLLIIFLFGAAGREMYKKHQEKMEAKAAAKNNDQNL